MKVFTVSLPNPGRLNAWKLVRGFTSEEARNEWLRKVHEWNKEMTGRELSLGVGNPPNPLGYDLDECEVFE